MNYDLKKSYNFSSHFSPIRPISPLPLKVRSLRHLRTNKKIRIPENLSSVYIGRPNSEIPPHINLEGFPDSEFVSHIHAKLEHILPFELYFIKDLFSRNGTYVNHVRLQPDSSHLLKLGDRISFGGHEMKFVFELL